MKNIYLFPAIILVLFSVNLYAQDTINLVNGDVFTAKVIEITDKQIKYKKATNLTGPIYTIDKREVLGIKYENNETDFFTTSRQLSSHYRFFKRSYLEGDVEIDRKAFENILRADMTNFANYKSGVNMRTTGYIIMVPSAIVFAYSMIDFPWFQIGAESDATLVVASGLTSVGAIALYLLGERKANKSIQSYNNNMSDFGLNINFNQNGLGLVVTF